MGPFKKRALERKRRARGETTAGPAEEPKIGRGPVFILRESHRPDCRGRRGETCSCRGGPSYRVERGPGHPDYAEGD